MEQTNATFSDQEILLDGMHYKACTFTKCEIVINGAGGSHLHECRFFDCRWRFVGPAGNTLRTLFAMSKGGLQNVVCDIFDRIIGGDEAILGELQSEG